MQWSKWCHVIAQIALHALLHFFFSVCTTYIAGVGYRRRVDSVDFINGESINDNNVVKLDETLTMTRPSCWMRSVPTL